MSEEAEHPDRADYVDAIRRELPVKRPVVNELRGTSGAKPTNKDRGLDFRLHRIPLPNPLVQPPPKKPDVPSKLRSLQELLAPADGSQENAASRTKGQMKELESDREKSSGARKDAPGQRTLNLPGFPIQ
jgi:hypothetical protein